MTRSRSSWLLLAFTFAAVAYLPAENLCTVVDNTPGAANFNTSVTIGTDGMPIISYRGIDGGSPNLSLVHCTAADCSTHDPITIADSTAHAFGPSVTIGFDGLPIISYTGTSSIGVDNLSVVHCEALDCNTYDTPVVLDNAHDAGQETSVKIGVDGLPIIAYQGADGLTSVHCSASDCSTHGPITTLAQAALASPSMAIGADGLPIMSFLGNDGILDFWVIHCSLLDCSGQNVVRRLDFNEDAGLFSSVAIGTDGLPIIGFYGGRFGRLVAIHCTAVDCSLQPAYNLVDNDTSAGAYSSIAVGNDGVPIISYEGAGGLTVVHCTNIDCSTHDPIAVLDNTAGSGRFTSIVIGVDGFPIISYAGINDDGSTNLSTVHCGTVSCTL